ncbi:MAG: hypothetical protein IPN46_16580 [Saprospiraceae bacterium]|nr:hypothetical protein [Saprospiraceae bacterium]
MILYVCNSGFADRLTPEDLQYLHGVDPRNTKPQIVNFDCNTIYMYFNDQAIGLNGVNSGDKKIIGSWTVLDWLTGSTYTYIRVFRVFVHGLEIC